MNRASHIAFAFALLLMGAALFLHSFAPRYQAMGIGSPVNPVFFPRILLMLWLGLAVAIVVAALRLNEPGQERPPMAWAPPLGMIAVMAASIWAIRWFGYIGVAGPLALACGWLLGYRRTGILLTVAALLAFGTWWLFDQALGIPLPRWRMTW